MKFGRPTECNMTNIFLEKHIKWEGKASRRPFYKK